ncbi:MAG TPA: 6-phosphogluconolactonase, partial [Verrucomicrobiae bacterium]
MLRWRLNRYPTTTALVQAAAERFLRSMHVSPASPKSRSVALAGGRVAGTFLAEAGMQAAAQKFDWNGVHFFWGDERCVPPDSKDSNYLLAAEALLNPCHIATNQIHRVQGELPPAAAVAEAEKALRTTVPRNAEGFPVLDLVLLGMGEDGHVASLFPDTPDELAFQKSAYVPVIGPKPPPQRVSLTFGVLAAAKEVWVIAS